MLYHVVFDKFRQPLPTMVIIVLVDHAQMISAILCQVGSGVYRTKNEGKDLATTWDGVQTCSCSSTAGAFHQNLLLKRVHIDILKCWWMLMQVRLYSRQPTHSDGICPILIPFCPPASWTEENQVSDIRTSYSCLIEPSHTPTVTAAMITDDTDDTNKPSKPSHDNLSARKRRRSFLRDMLVVWRWLACAILAQAAPPLILGFDSRWGAMWPAATVNDVDGVLAYYGVSAQVWGAFCHAVGDPHNDLRLVANLPSTMVAEAVAQCRMESGRRYTPIEAIQVGMVFRACNYLTHLAMGAPANTWVDPNPWATTLPSTGATGTTPSSTPPTSPERKMKLSQVADQGDESEFMVLPETKKAAFYARYVAKVGGLPSDAEDASIEQISAVIRKVRHLGQPPYCDFAVFVPFAKKHLKAQKYQSFLLQEDGSFLSKMVPGPGCFSHWQACFRVLRTTLVMTEVISLANLMEWEAHVERLSRQFPGCWGLIAAADDRGRGAWARLSPRCNWRWTRGDRRPWDGTPTSLGTSCGTGCSTTKSTGWNKCTSLQSPGRQGGARANLSHPSRSWPTTLWGAAHKLFYQTPRRPSQRRVGRGRIEQEEKLGRGSFIQKEKSWSSGEKVQKVEEAKETTHLKAKVGHQKRPATPGTMGMAFAATFHLENLAKQKCHDATVAQPVVHLGILQKTAQRPRRSN